MLRLYFRVRLCPCNLDLIALPEARKHLQIQACNHPDCDISMGSIDHVVTSTRTMLPAVRDVQPNVRRRPVSFCRDLLNDPVACSVFRDQIAESPVCALDLTTDPHTHAELLSGGIISCAKRAFPLNTGPPQGLGPLPSHGTSSSPVVNRPEPLSLAHLISFGVLR